MFPEYKSGRAGKHNLRRDQFATIEEEQASMRKQMVRIVQYLNLLPVQIFCIDNIEADDVIAYLTMQYFQPKGSKVRIDSTDGDFLQLISENVEVYSPVKKKLYDQELLHIEAYFNLKAMTIFLLHFPYLTDQFQYLDTEVDKPFLLTLDIVRVEPIIGVFSVLLNHIRFENSDEFLSAWKVFHQANVEGSLERLWEK